MQTGRKIRKAASLAPAPWHTANAEPGSRFRPVARKEPIIDVRSWCEIKDLFRSTHLLSTAKCTSCFHVRRVALPYDEWLRGCTRDASETHAGLIRLASPPASSQYLGIPLSFTLVVLLLLLGLAICVRKTSVGVLTCKVHGCRQRKSCVQDSLPIPKMQRSFSCWDREMQGSVQASRLYTNIDAG